MPQQRFRTPESGSSRRWARALGAVIVAVAVLLAGLSATVHAANGQPADLANRLEDSQWLSLNSYNLQLSKVA
jgi:hypothetical protein